MGSKVASGGADQAYEGCSGRHPDIWKPGPLGEIGDVARKIVPIGGDAFGGLLEFVVKLDYSSPS